MAFRSRSNILLSCVSSSEPHALGGTATSPPSAANGAVDRSAQGCQSVLHAALRNWSGHRHGPDGALELGQPARTSGLALTKPTTHVLRASIESGAKPFSAEEVSHAILTPRYPTWPRPGVIARGPQRGTRYSGAHEPHARQIDDDRPGGVEATQVRDECGGTDADIGKLLGIHFYYVSRRRVNGFSPKQVMRCDERRYLIRSDLLSIVTPAISPRSQSATSARPGP